MFPSKISPTISPFASMTGDPEFHPLEPGSVMRAPYARSIAAVGSRLNSQSPSLARASNG
jgi:hypothetical protein